MVIKENQLFCHKETLDIVHVCKPAFALSEATQTYKHLCLHGTEADSYTGSVCFKTTKELVKDYILLDKELLP